MNMASLGRDIALQGGVTRTDVLCPRGSTGVTQRTKYQHNFDLNPEILWR